MDLPTIGEYAEFYWELRSGISNEDAVIAILAEWAKDRRTTWINQVEGNTKTKNDKPTVIYKSEPATENQLKFLKELKIDCDQDITRGEASALIDQAKGRKAKLPKVESLGAV